MSTIPRLVISAPSSGHGKTAVSVGLLSALSARGYRAAGFKIGPDHVDAAYLGLAAGRPGRNLDPRMIGAKRMGPLFAHGAGSLDIAVVEGTMGLFDGLAGRTDSESTAQISGLLRAPVVLVVDASAMARTAAEIVHGYATFDADLDVAGVIYNKVGSDHHEELLREATAPLGIPVLGAVRRDERAPGALDALAGAARARRSTAARSIERAAAPARASSALRARSSRSSAGTRPRWRSGATTRSSRRTAPRTGIPSGAVASRRSSSWWSEPTLL